MTHKETNKEANAICNFPIKLVIWTFFKKKLKS